MKFNLAYLGIIILGACVAGLVGFIVITCMIDIFQKSIPSGIFMLTVLIGATLITIGMLKGDLN